MIAGIIAFGAVQPFVAGLFVGGCGFGGALGVMGWCFGYEAAMRKARSWMRPARIMSELHIEVRGDMPTLPPIRDRRPIATTPGRYV